MSWIVDDPRNCYSPGGWGEACFDVNKQGYLSVSLTNCEQSIASGYGLPISPLRRRGRSWPNRKPG
jgi:hypothetical protein